jgi:hypothetical protein
VAVAGAPIQLLLLVAQVAQAAVGLEELELLLTQLLKQGAPVQQILEAAAVQAVLQEVLQVLVEEAGTADQELLLLGIQELLLERQAVTLLFLPAVL